MIIPEKITITSPRISEGNVITLSQDVYFAFNYNAITQLRKSEGLTMEEYSNIFSALSDKTKDIDKLAKANEYFGKLFYFAILEGMRSLRLENVVTLDDVHSFLNDPDNFAAREQIGKAYGETLVRAMASDEVKKKVQKNHTVGTT